MKLATLKDSTRDGRLVVVSRDLTRCSEVGHIARNLQAALDDWAHVAPRLERVAEGLETGSQPTVRFHEHDAASPLQREIESRLLESLDHWALRHRDEVPQVVVDVACGPARAAHALRARWPRSQVIALDAALPMLHAARDNTRGQFLRAREIPRLNADLRALPLADGSVDLLFCNLALQWIDDLTAAFAGFRRVLKPGGMLLVSTFGSETLAELREAFAAVVARFPDRVAVAG